MRNMINANKSAFEKIFSRYSLLAEEEINLKDGKFYIQTNLVEKEWLKKVQIGESSVITRQLSASELTFEGRLYYAFWGYSFGQRNFDEEVIKVHEINAGILTALLSETPVNLDVNIRLSEFKETFSVQHLQPDYKGYSSAEVLQFLPPVVLIEIPENSALAVADIYRIACYLIVNETSLIVLPYRKNTIDSFLRLILEEGGVLSFENIFNALTSVNWRHSYLELYRCIERLFPIKFLKELQADLGLTGSLVAFAEKIEDRTSWRPKENVAIEKIFEDCPESISVVFKSCINNLDGQQDVLISNYVYKLRNSIVHFRSKQSQIKLNDDQWSEILYAQCEFIGHLYKKFQVELR